MNDKKLNIEFHELVVDSIQGWLHRITSLATMELLSFQESQGDDGPIIEIGVYKGKYFSLLARSATRTNSKILGIDTFTFSHEDEVLENLKLSNEISPENIILWRNFSSQCNSKEVLKKIKAYARFISIDGSHECEDVYLDLILSEKLLSSTGIIAVDDFINPMTLGVNEAVNKYFSEERNVVPFAYISNKLFLSFKDTAIQYKNFIESILPIYNEEVEVNTFLTNIKQSRHMIEQRIFKSSVLICF